MLFFHCGSESERRQNKKECGCVLSSPMATSGYACQFRKKIESDGAWYCQYPPTKNKQRRTQARCRITALAAADIMLAIISRTVTM